MRITLENETGKARGKVVISAGEFLRIGRIAPAELSGGEDRFMSGSHFMIECNQSRCRLADMGSRNGTFVNGTQVKEVVLRDGDVISAGQTRFRVHLEQKVEAPAAASAVTSTTDVGNETHVFSDAPKDLRDVLSPQSGEHLYALLDAARDDRILELLSNSGERYQSLYEGRQGEDLANVAPYLVALPKDSTLLDALIKEGWGNSWGIYLISQESFEEVREHFRHFLLVQTEDGKELYFRFYDPRVLRIFWVTCGPEEIGVFFGPVQHIFVEKEGDNTILCFQPRTTSDKGTDSLEANSNDSKRMMANYQVLGLRPIRLASAQLQAFGHATTARFEEEMVQHLNEFAPELCRILNGKVLGIIRTGISRAGDYRLTSRGAVRLYIELMFTFGTDFDTDPQLPWARRILTDITAEDQGMRAERLYHSAMQYLHHVAGPENAYAVAALRRSREIDFSKFEVRAGDFEAEMLATLQAIYPQKTSYVGELALRQLISHSFQYATQLSIVSTAGKAILLGLMFGFGHGILVDPIYPWVRATLTRQPSDSRDRIEQLYNKAEIYADHILRNNSSNSYDEATSKSSS